MERRERDKQARALMSQQVINAETEPSAAPSLFAAPVRVSYCCFIYSMVCFIVFYVEEI